MVATRLCVPALSTSFGPSVRPDALQRPPVSTNLRAIRDKNPVHGDLKTERSDKTQDVRSRAASAWVFGTFHNHESHGCSVIYDMPEQ